MRSGSCLGDVGLPRSKEGSQLPPPDLPQFLYHMCSLTLTLRFCITHRTVHHKENAQLNYSVQDEWTGGIGNFLCHDDEALHIPVTLASICVKLKVKVGPESI